MRLSEAIRLGAMLKPQGQLNIVHRGKTCVLGAALDAIGALVPRRRMAHRHFYEIAKRRWPLLTEYWRHPVFDHMYTVERICTNLNDDHGWTRERIADWVATIEDATPVSVEAATVTVPVCAQ